MSQKMINNEALMRLYNKYTDTYRTYNEIKLVNQILFGNDSVYFHNTNLRDAAIKFCLARSEFLDTVEDAFRTQLALPPTDGPEDE